MHKSIKTSEHDHEMPQTETTDQPLHPEEETQNDNSDIKNRL